MSPGTRARISTLLIAVTRPMRSPVSVTGRVAAGVTETAGGGTPWAVAAPHQAMKHSAPMAALKPRELLRPSIKIPPHCELSLSHDLIGRGDLLHTAGSSAREIAGDQGSEL